MLTRFQVPLIVLITVVCLQVVAYQPIAQIMSSPTGIQLKEQLFPNQLETLNTGEVAVTPAISARDRASMYPAETMRRCIWLGLMALVFTRVQDLANVDTLRRLSYVCLINGSILAYFSIIQHFTEDETGKVFWTFQSMGAAFGPFVNRNHFAFYINICFGLSLGLVGSRLFARFSRFDLDGLIESLKDSFSLWMVSVLVFMLGAVILCSSRGGMISLVGSLLITAAFMASTGTFQQGWRWFVLAAAIFAVGAWVQVWLGFDFADSRYMDHSDDRTALWLPLLKLVREFPLFGTGLGTLPFVEPWTRTSAQQNFYLEYAHNEYLQLAIETGLVGLGCGCVFLLLLATKIAKRIRESRHNSWLYVGLLFSLCSISLHSFTEFGLAIPAIAFLAAVVMGHIAGVGRAATEQPASRITKGLLRLSSIGIVAFAVLAFQQAKQFDLGERYLLAAQRAKNAGDFETELANYQKALSHTPHDVEFLMEVARLRLEQFESQTLGNPTALQEAQQVLVTVRELSPMSGLSHYMIGRRQDTFQNADAPLDYYLRSAISRPMDPTLAFILGSTFLESGQKDEAIKNFKRSLELNPKHLNDILDKSSVTMSQQELTDKLLPMDNAPALIKAANWFATRQKEKQLDFTGVINGLRRQALETREMEFANTVALCKQKADLYLQLGDKENAIKALEVGLRYEPDDKNLRLRVARMLAEEEGRESDARYHLQQIFRKDRNHKAARELLRELAVRKAKE